MGEVHVRSLGEPGDLGWVVMANAEGYAQEFGWDATYEALVARIVADYAADERPKAAWIAELDGRRVGCVFGITAAPGVAQLRLLLVDPVARGQRLGARLVDQCVEWARTEGFRRMVLWTNDPLVAARRIYLDAGFQLVDEEPHHSYGVDLVGQNYALEL